MSDSFVFAVYGLCAVLRLWQAKGLLAVTGFRGPDWFLDARFPAGSGVLLGLRTSYRKWILSATVASEILAMADLMTRGNRRHVILGQAALTLAVALARRLTLRVFVLRARELSTPRPSAQTVCSLKTRKLAQYTNWSFELPNGAVVAGACAAMIVSHPGESYLLVALVLAYAQVGFVLAKASFLRKSVPLPTQCTDEYMALAEEFFRLKLRDFDASRGMMTAVLAGLAVNVWSWDLALATVGVAVVVWALLVARAAASKRALVERVKALDVVAPMRRLTDPENLRLGGLVYLNPDNPSVIVDGGPLRLAVNVVNRNTYLYAGYWTGLLLLFVALGIRL